MIVATRFDSNSANNPSLNLTGADAIAIEFVPDGPNGDLQIETNNGLPDEDTLIEINGVTYDFTLDFVGTLPFASNQGGNQVPSELQGEAIAVVVINDFPAPGETSRLFFFPEADVTLQQMDSIGNGAIRIQNRNDNPPPFPVCYARGTQILTANGPAAVEDLRRGDMVETMDAGPQPIIWAGRTTFRWPGAADTAKPIQISSNAELRHKPDNDLVVSPQHLLLVRDAKGRDTFCPAKGLTGMRGVRVMHGKRRVDYHHILLQRRHVIFAEGIPTESFFPGPVALQALSAADRREIFRLIPKLVTDPGAGYGPSARPKLKANEVKRRFEEFTCEPA